MALFRSVTRAIGCAFIGSGLLEMGNLIRGRLHQHCRRAEAIALRQCRARASGGACGCQRSESVNPGARATCLRSSRKIRHPGDLQVIDGVALARWHDLMEVRRRCGVCARFGTHGGALVAPVPVTRGSVGTSSRGRCAQPAHRRVVEIAVLPVETDGIDPWKQLDANPAGFDGSAVCRGSSGYDRRRRVGRRGCGSGRSRPGRRSGGDHGLPRRTGAEPCAGRDRVRTDGVVAGSG